MLLDLLSDLSRSSGSIAAAQSSQSASLVGVERFIAAIAQSQAAQSSSETASEDFRANIVSLQTVQSTALVGQERFLASLAAAQAGQTADLSGLERFIAATATAQVGQSTDIEAAEGSPNRTATIDTIQLAQTGDIEVLVPIPLEPPATPAQGWVHGARVTGRASGKRPVPKDAIAAISTIQRSQTTHIEASENDDDDLAYLYLELAA